MCNQQMCKLTAEEPEAPAADLAAIAEIIEEIRFYLAHSLLDLAQGAFAKFKHMNPDPALVSLIHHEMEAATANVAAQAEAAGICLPKKPKIMRQLDSPTELRTEPYPSP